MLQHTSLALGSQGRCYGRSMTTLLDRLATVLQPEQILVGDQINEDYSHDEAVTVDPVMPMLVVRPRSTADIASIAALANELGVSITARGSGTGLSGAAIANEDGILLSLEFMKDIIEVDQANHVAVVQPGVTLGELDEALAPLGLVYPIMPGEASASLGGNVATNAGGMRAVKYGVTRHQVLGMEVVLATGEVIRAGGKYVKATTGYDLGQLIIGSEGTLAIITEITLKVVPRLNHTATVLAPFGAMRNITEAVPKIIGDGLGPLMLEYMDALAMASTTQSAGLELGIPQAVQDEAVAYLLMVLESSSDERLQQDTERAAELLAELGALDIYVLPPGAGREMLEARENAFWVVKEMGVNDIVDVVVPRASIPEYMEQVAGLAEANEAWVAGAGHAGDGNVHMSVFQPDKEKCQQLMTDILSAGMDLGGAISAEHGIGLAKLPYMMELEDPIKIALMRGIKAAFDPNGILNPGKVFL